MSDLVRIVTPENGMALHTKVTMADGSAIPGVLSVTISPMNAGAVVKAEISLLIGQCDIHAHPLLSLESLKEAAEAHGYRLEKA